MYLGLTIDPVLRKLGLYLVEPQFCRHMDYSPACSYVMADNDLSLFKSSASAHTYFIFFFILEYHQLDLILYCMALDGAVMIRREFELPWNRLQPPGPTCCSVCVCGITVHGNLSGTCSLDSELSQESKGERVPGIRGGH